MSAWLKRFGLHLAAAVGATGIFVAAAAVGASQTRQQVASSTPPIVATRTRQPGGQSKPSVVVSPSAPPSVAAAVPTAGSDSAPPVAPSNAPSPRPTPRNTPAPAAAPAPTPAPGKVIPERSLAGTVKDVVGEEVDIVGIGGREWRVIPAPGALIRLNGKAARVDTLQAVDTVVILGQAQPGGPGLRFLAHAITARHK